MSFSLSMERIIVHLDMDAYFASVEQRLNPSLRGKPVFVCGNPKTRTVVAACSYEAKAFGVKSGMSVGEARALCPDAVLVSGDPVRYEETSRAIFAALASHITPDMEIYSIDEAFLDIGGIVGFHGGKEAVAGTIKNLVRETTGLTCSVGVGPNKLISKIAAGLRKPDGLMIVEPDNVPALMENLPVGKVPGIGPRIGNRLSDWGITVCGEIARMDEEFFTGRFGVYGSFIWHAARGEDFSPVVATPPAPKSCGRSYTLPKGTNDRRLLRAVLFRLSGHVAEQMRREQMRGRTAVFCVRTEKFMTFTRRRTFREIPPDGKRIFHLGWELFLSFGETLGNEPVRLLGISVGELFPGEHPSLFPEEEMREDCFAFVDRINERFGGGTVFPATFLIEQHLQEPVRKIHAFDFNKRIAKR